MDPELRARPTLEPGRIELAWRWSSLDPTRPRFRVVRRQGGPAEAIGEGWLVLDMAEWFKAATTPWGQVEHHRFLLDRTPAEGGLEQAQIALYFDPPTVEPVRVVVSHYDGATATVQTVDLADVTRVVRTRVQPTPTDPATYTWEIFQAPGGGAEVSAGVAAWTVTPPPVVPAPPLPAESLNWTPAGGPTLTVGFERYQAQIAVRQALDPVTFVSVTGTWLTPLLSIKEAFNPDTGEADWDVSLIDDGLTHPGVRYYTLFVPDATTPSGFVTARAMALPAVAFGTPDQLYQLLPQYHRYADEPDPAPARRGTGPLRRLLTPFGLAIDRARSGAEQLRGNYDPASVRLDLVPHLARLIGWEPDLAATPLTQRNDIRAAPALFQTVGTRANLETLVNRVTGWPCRIKEFVHNIFLTNAPESQRLWELWQNRHDGTAWGAPASITLTTAADGRPALAVDGGGVLWAFWHSDRDGRRELWRQRLDGVDAAPALARAGAPDDLPGTEMIEEDPAVVFDGTSIRLFWSSVQNGQRDLWSRAFTGGPPAGAAERLTDHPASDGSPAVVVVPGAPARLWLFWSSTRRGPADIWGQSQDLVTGQWTAAERFTESPLRDDRPAATVDAAGRIWLFWTRDAGGTQALWHKVLDGTSGEMAIVTDHARDASPAAVPWKNHVLLLWHSDHPDGQWRLWGAFHDGTHWLPPVRLNNDVQRDLEPAAAIEAGGALRLLWRSQRRAMWYRSRTLDTDDTEMLGALGSDADHAHYMYATGLTNGDWYARGTVGLFVTPDTLVPDEVTAQVELLRAFVEPFRPLPIRFVWVADQPVHTEVLSPGPSFDEEWDDALI